MRVGPAVNVARVSVDETITALWTFANALGLLTDDINERTAAAGVTVDGMLIRDSGIPQAAVTAHEAALSILETQIPDGALLARNAVAEAITALWAFSHASGLQTDTISERTPAAGVTIDGALIQDRGFFALGLAMGTDLIFRATVTGDAFDRFIVQADGRLRWGPGSAGGDTVLYRAALNLLATDDDFRVAGAAGVVTDDISERTAAAGVRIDGGLLQDGSFDSRLLAAVASNFLVSAVTGDSNVRYVQQADGAMLWGSGAAAGDTNLFRAAANELATDDDFNVGGVLDLAGDIELESRTVVLNTGDNHDVVTGTVPLQRFGGTGASSITGLAGGRANRILIITNHLTAGTVSLSHQDAGSLAANRIIGPNATSVNLDQGESVILWYDDATSRWRILSRSN